MQIKVNKFDVLIAATRYLSDSPDLCSDIQRIEDILSGKHAELIQSVTLDDYEFELLTPYFEEN